MMVIRTTFISVAFLGAAACGGGTNETASAPETLAASIVENAPEITAEPEQPAPLSAEAQAIANAEINMTALAAYRDHVEQLKSDTGTYPVTKKSFRSALGVFEDVAKESANDGEELNLDLPEGAEMTKPGRIVYRSDGEDYKLIAQRTGDCSVVRDQQPELIDPKRTYGPGDCIAYGYWTGGAENW